MRSLDSLLASRPFAVLDGALATELERRGADLNDPLWSARILIDRPQLIRAVHEDYLDAGADIITTATYQATFEGFRRHGIGAPQAAGLLRLAVDLAIEARDRFWGTGGGSRATRVRPLVAASVGPYGAMLADGSEYRGGYALRDSELRDFHAPRLAVLAASGADLLAFETLPCLREALVLARLLESYPHLSAWISFSCRDGDTTCEGDDVAACGSALDGCGQVVAVGVNCTHPAHVTAVLRRLRSGTGKPLIAYPNSGETYEPADKTWSRLTDLDPDSAAGPRAWLAAGARILGGCCRTTPDDTAALRRMAG